MSLPFLSINIIISILLLLPAKALIRFLVACKSWCETIKTQDFITKHFETSIAIGKNYILYVSVLSKPEKTLTLLNHKTFQYESELRVPFDLPGMLNCNVVGSVNGLICLTDITHFGHTIYLTNPSINKYLILPLSSTYCNEFDLQIIQVSLGFSYHKIANDFRIELIEHDNYGLNEDDYKKPIISPYGYDVVVRAGVFSLNTKVWKALEVSPNLSYNRIAMVSGVVVNERLHWKTIKSNTYEDEIVILSFHMREETFQEIEGPNFHGERGINLTACIGEFKGKLGFFAFCPVWSGLGKQPCHLSVMEEYGNKNS